LQRNDDWSAEVWTALNGAAIRKKSTAHLREHISQDPSILAKLATAVRRRYDVLQSTAGLNTEVFDTLLLIASGGWDPADLRRGHESMMGLLREMD
jgi:hypothetical protein